MKYIDRLQEKLVIQTLDRNKSILLLGPRQTGKTTLMERLGADLSLSFVRPDVRQKYEKNPELLTGEVEAIVADKKTLPLVALDEIQKIPVILDVVQDLIDRKLAKFILSGSSARKLRRNHEINLLPGRIAAMRLTPLALNEKPPKNIQEALLYGSLPGILSVVNNADRELDLQSYVTTYLEEEIRAEAVVKNLGPFARFLELAAAESGKLINFRRLSQEIGVSHTTISAYFQILEDCLIIDRIEPITKSSIRKKLTKSNKYLFFDLGVRRVAAKEGIKLPKQSFGHLFEQFVGLELLRYAKNIDHKISLRFWRDLDGPEVDWVIESQNEFIPLEVKWSDSPTLKDARHLQTFLNEYSNASKAYIVCQAKNKIQLKKNIFALPWQELLSIF